LRSPDFHGLAGGHVAKLEIELRKPILQRRGDTEALPLRGQGDWLIGPRKSIVAYLNKDEVVR
jgi:hypothetical protein